MVSRARHGDGFIYVARAPRVVGYLYYGSDIGRAEASCVDHLNKHELIDVHVACLPRPALNWAVARVLGVAVSVGVDSVGAPACVLGDPQRVYDPAGDWEQGGPVLDRFGVIDTDLAPACRAVVGMLGGNVVKVPAVLLGVVDG